MNPQNPVMIQGPNYLLRFIFKLSPSFERELFRFLRLEKLASSRADLGFKTIKSRMFSLIKHNSTRCAK